MTLSKEIRDLVETKYDESKTYREISAELKLKYRTVQSVIRAKKHYELPGNQRKPRGTPAKLNSEDRKFIQQLIDADYTRVHWSR